MGHNVLPWKNLSMYYFISEEDYQRSGNFKVKCLVCSKNNYISTSASSSSNLRKHLKIVHPAKTIEPIRGTRRKTNLDGYCSPKSISPRLIESENYFQELHEASETMNPFYGKMQNAQRDQFFAQCGEYRRLNTVLEELQRKSPRKRKVSGREFQHPFKRQDLDNMVLDNIFSKLQRLKDAFERQPQNNIFSGDEESEGSVLGCSDNESFEGTMTASQRQQFLSQCAQYKMLNTSLQRKLRPISKKELADSSTSCSPDESTVKNTTKAPVMDQVSSDRENMVSPEDTKPKAEDISSRIDATGSTNGNEESTTADVDHQVSSLHDTIVRPEDTTANAEDISSRVGAPCSIKGSGESTTVDDDHQVSSLHEDKI